VEAGEPVAMFHFNDSKRANDAEEAFRSGLEIGDRDVAKRPLVLDVIKG
jgi:thymidine phosphorylase